MIVPQEHDMWMDIGNGNKIWTLFIRYSFTLFKCDFVYWYIIKYISLCIIRFTYQFRFIWKYIELYWIHLENLFILILYVTPKISLYNKYEYLENPNHKNLMIYFKLWINLKSDKEYTIGSQWYCFMDILCTWAIRI